MKDEDGIKNGTYNVSVKYPIDQCHHIEKLSGVQKLLGERILITRYGEQKRCNFCHLSGHLKRECPKYKMISPKCNKRGHLKCNWRNQFFDNNEENDEDEDLEDAKDHLQ